MLTRFEMVVLDGQVAQALHRFTHDPRRSAEHLKVKTHQQLMTAGGDLIVAAIIHSTVVQTLGHEQFAARCRGGEVDPGHLRIDRRQRAQTTGNDACGEYQQQPAHDKYSETCSSKHSPDQVRWQPAGVPWPMTFRCWS